MLITKTNPVGLDFYIQQLQTKLHNKLIVDWALSDATKYECYGRCYRNKRENGYIAEVFTSGNEYKEVYWNDQLTAISFFGLSSSIKKGIQSEADVHLVFFVNLQKLALKDPLVPANTIAHRADGEVRKSVEDIIGKRSYGFTLMSVDLWLENVLKEYAGSYRDKRLIAVDMHPVHCFRLNLKLTYDPNKIC